MVWLSRRWRRIWGLQACGAPGGHAAVVCDGPVALVPLLVGGGRRMGPGHQGGGPRLLPLDSAGWQAGRPSAGCEGAAPATVAHCETVLRGFYGFCLEAGTGPMVNPFPLARGRRGRANAHHNPMDPFRAERAGRYRPKTPRRIPRQIPDEKFDELFARLGSHRDRALVAFSVSTGARPPGCCGARAGRCRPGPRSIAAIPQGHAGAAAVAGLPGCVRVAAALPPAGARAGPGGAR